MRRLFISGIVLFLVSALFACETSGSVVSIAVDSSTVPESAMLGSFDVEELILEVEYSTGETNRISLSENMLDESDLAKLGEVGTHTVTVNYRGVSTSFVITLDPDDSDQAMRAIHQLALEAEATTLTYDEWLESVKGERGADGREINLRVANGSLQWQYEDETDWRTLYDLRTLTGPEGEDGSQVVFQVSETHIEWRYDDETEWNELVELDMLMGANGKDVSLRVSEGHIQWQLIGDDTWMNLIELATLAGPTGQDGEDGREVAFQVDGGYIQWQYAGDSVWIDLISLESLAQTGGQDGREVTFQVSEGYIQWQYTGDTTWTNLVELATLVGPAGSDGQDGEDGEDGREVTFQVAGGYIQWQYSGDTTWTNLIELASLVGPSGSDGQDGIGIVSTEINDLGEVIITYSDGESVNIGKIYDVHIVQIKDIQGHVIDVQRVIHGFDADEPTPPSVPGYTFVEWDDTFENILADKVITAVYEPELLTITFDTGGCVTVEPLSGIPYGTTVTLPLPECEGFVFDGWYLGNTVNDAHFTNSTIIYENLTVYARWISQVVTVEFVDYDDTILTIVDVLAGSDVLTPSDPTREGYVFLGWDTPTSNIVSDTVIRAQYEIASYTISYVVDETTTLGPETYEYNQVIVLPDSPGKEGFIFNGWFEDPQYEQPLSYTHMPASDLILYALWVPELDISGPNALYFELIEESEDTLTLAFRVGGEVGLIGYDIHIYYDEEVLQVVSYQNGLPNFVNINQSGKILFNFVDFGQRITNDSLLITFTFERIENVSSVISIDVIDMIDRNIEDVIIDADYSTNDYHIR